MSTDTPYCVDASAVMTWILPVGAGATSRAFWEEALRAGSRLVAPPLLYAEVTSALRRLVFAGHLLPDEAAAGVTTLLAIPLVSVSSLDLYLRALDMAASLQVSKAYDAQYLAAAELEGCTLVTADLAMAEHASKLGIARRHLVTPKR